MQIQFLSSKSIPIFSERTPNAPDFVEKKLSASANPFESYTGCKQTLLTLCRRALLPAQSRDQDTLELGSKA